MYTMKNGVVKTSELFVFFFSSHHMTLSKNRKKNIENKKVFQSNCRIFLANQKTLKLL